MSVDSGPKDTVSESFTSLSTMTLFLPALLVISPAKSAFTQPCLSSMGKRKEGVEVCSRSVLRQAAQVNWEERRERRTEKYKR